LPALEQLLASVNGSGKTTSIAKLAHILSQDNKKVIVAACDTFRAAAATAADILILDTAGRLHTKTDLMRELIKIRDVVTRTMPGAPNEVLLVLDATTGQNAIVQAKMFTEAINVTGIFLARLDIPVKFVGLGEKPTDIAEFDPDSFVEALFS
jgi:fused signal recognition particle receptor